MKAERKIRSRSLRKAEFSERMEKGKTWARREGKV